MGRTIEHRLAKCVSCGERLEQRPHIDDLEPFDLDDAMQARCKACAKEVLGLGIPKVGTMQHGTGGGRRVIKETKTH